MFIALICAVLFFLNVWRRTWMLPSVGLALLALSAVLLGLIWPGIVQQFQVKPSEADKEAPYIDTNIQATRAAYGIKDVKPQTYSSRASASTAKLANLESETSAVPLVDPHLVRDTFEQNQQIRAYYSVADVLDVDRYRIQGVDRALVLGVRELDQNGINAGDRNWSNLHTVYTHGNGIIAAFANQRPASNSRRVHRHPVGRGAGPATTWASTRAGSTTASRAPTTRSSASSRASPTWSSTWATPPADRPRTTPRRTPARAASRSGASSTG